MSKIAVLIADDIEVDREKVCQILESSAIGLKYDRLACECADSIPFKLQNLSPSVATNIIRERKAEGQPIDLALVDMIFEPEFGESMEGGEKIISELQECFPSCRIIILSKQFGKVAAQYAVNGRNYPAIDKTAKLDIQVGVIHDELLIWTRSFFNKVTVADRRCIRDAVLSDQCLPVVNVNGCDWVPDNFLLLYPTAISKADLLSLLIPNLMWAFSEAFGTLGIKQITHYGGKYYSSDPVELHSKVAEQIGVLDCTLSAVRTHSSLVAAKLGYDGDELVKNSIAEHYNQFKQVYERLGSSVFDGTLQQARETHFQFKGSDASGTQNMTEGLQAILARHKPTIITSGELDVISLNGCQGTEIFEVNLPIHKIFEDELGEMFKRIFPNTAGKTAGVQNCQVFSTAYLVSEAAQDGSKLRLCNNLLVFRYAATNLRPEEWTTSSDQPQWVESFQSSLPWFGRLLLMTRRSTSSDFEVFDCTYWPSHGLGTFKQWISEKKANSMHCMVEEDQTYTTYHVLSFPGWRQ